jgi:hypothetical protein
LIVILFVGPAVAIILLANALNWGHCIWAATPTCTYYMIRVWRR